MQLLCRRRAPVALLLALVLLALCARMCTARMYFKDFRDVSRISLVGSARRSPREPGRPACLSLTQGGATPDQRRGNQTGAAWYTNKIHMQSKYDANPKQGPDAFITSFHFRITPAMHALNMTARRQEALARLAEASGAQDSDASAAAGAASAAADPAAALVAEELTQAMPPGGDGFAFVMRSAQTVKPGKAASAAVGPQALGRPGSGLGYAGLPGPGLAIEFDTRMNLAERDPNANHVSVHVQQDGGSGLGSGTGAWTTLHSYESDDMRVASLPFAQLSLRRPRILVSPNPALKRQLSGGSKSNKALVAQISYQPQLRSLKVFVEDLVSPVLVVSGVPPLQGQFWIGFTASTSGDSADTHEICQWYFEKQRTKRLANIDVADGGVGGDGSGDGSSSADLASTVAKLALVADPKPKVQEGCDSGFTGDSCMLDVASAEKECLFATRAGCGGCLSHASGHCVWCSSQKRCISSEMATRAFDKRAHAPYCSDPASIVEDQAECMEAPGYVVWAAGAVLFLGAVCVIIGLTGNLWIRAKRNGTLVQDVMALLFYTISGSMFSIFMTSLVNLVLIEITTSSDQWAGWGLGFFLALFTGVLYRDVQAFLAREYGETSVGAAEAGRWRSGGLGSRGGSSINAAGVSYAQILNPDDEIASRAILQSFEKQHRLGPSHAPPPPPPHHAASLPPLAGSLVSGALHAPSWLRAAYRRLSRWQATVRGQLAVPHFFACQIGASSLLSFVLLTHRDWSTTWEGAAWKRCVYAVLSISLAFSLAYLLLTAWRLVRIFLLAAWQALCGRHGPLNCCFGREGWAPPPSKDVDMRDGAIGAGVDGSGSVQGLPFAAPSSSSLSLSAQLSSFAHTSLVSSIAQVRIMGTCALISGFYFGTMFGGLDKEDATKSHIDVVIQRENYYSYPLAAFLGATSAFTNQYLALYRIATTEPLYIYDAPKL